MVSYRGQPAAPLAADGEALARILGRSSVGRQHTIWVTGPAGLTALIWLNQHGYGRASYAHLERVGAMVPADALLVPHACDPATVADLLRDATCLREGGVLIAQVSGGISADSLRDVPALIEPLGYRLEYRVHEKGRTICVARRRGGPHLSVAA